MTRSYWPLLWYSASMLVCLLDTGVPRWFPMSLTVLVLTMASAHALMCGIEDAASTVAEPPAPKPLPAQVPETIHYADRLFEALSTAKTDRDRAVAVVLATIHDDEQAQTLIARIDERASQPYRDLGGIGL